MAGDQVQIIFGAGLVNDVYEVFAEHNNMKNMSLSDLKTVANKNEPSAKNYKSTF